MLRRKFTQLLIHEDRGRISCQWFIPKCLQYLELGQFKAGSQEFNPVSIMSGRDKITAATSMLRCLSVGGWIQEVRLKFRLSRVGCEHPWQPCKRYDTCPSQLIFLLLFFHEVHLTSVFLFSIFTKESFFVWHFWKNHLCIAFPGWETVTARKAYVGVLIFVISKCPLLGVSYFPPWNPPF